MPLYEYQCDACGQRFEVIQKFSDPHVDVCAACGKGPVTRLLSSPAIQFKGSGWYVTDYAQKGKSDGKSATKADAGKSEGTDAAKSDKTSETASKSDSSPSTTPAGTKE